MINDTERREVARRLRGIDAERLDRVYGMDGEGGECSDPDMAKAGRNLMLGAIAEAVGLHYAPYYFDAAPLRDRLADLIEPSCDRDALQDTFEDDTGQTLYTSALLPCPFCGRPAHIRELLRAHGGPLYSASCPTLRCYGFEADTWYRTPYDAARAWNRRAPRSMCGDCAHAEESPYGLYCNRFKRYTETYGYCKWAEVRDDSSDR